jgi:hypothetical protein
VALKTKSSVATGTTTGFQRAAVDAVPFTAAAQFTIAPCAVDPTAAMARDAMPALDTSMPT